MDKADYSRTTVEEREKVIEILYRNLETLLKGRKVKAPEQLRKRVDALAKRIRAGEIITGKDYEQLLRLFQKKP